MSKVDLDSVRGHIAILQMVKRKMAELKELQAASRAAVEEAMGTADTGVLDDEPVVTWPTYKENRFDSAKFREDHPELWESYKVPNEKRKFDVL